MTTNNTITTLMKFRESYTRAYNEIEAIRSNNDLTPDAKERRIEEITRARQAEIGPLKMEAVQELENLRNTLKEKHKNDIVSGLKEADKISMITEGIKNGSFDAEMITQIKDIYVNNPIGLDAIRGALNNSPDEETRLLAAAIPVDNTGKLIEGVGKAINNVSSVPPVNASVRTDDMAAAMWQSGASFDSLIQYIESIDNE